MTGLAPSSALPGAGLCPLEQDLISAINAVVQLVYSFPLPLLQALAEG